MTPSWAVAILILRRSQEHLLAYVVTYCTHTQLVEAAVIIALSISGVSLGLQLFGCSFGIDLGKNKYLKLSSKVLE